MNKVQGPKSIKWDSITTGIGYPQNIPIGAYSHTPSQKLCSKRREIITNQCFYSANTSGKVLIRFGTYNIHNGRNGGLEAALRGMSQANMELGILQETKLTDGIYTRKSAWYSVIATDTPR